MTKTEFKVRAFLKELAENGLLSSTYFHKYEMCTKCKFLSATLGDVNFIREQVIQEYRNRNINISIEVIN